MRLIVASILLVGLACCVPLLDDQPGLAIRAEPTPSSQHGGAAALASLAAARSSAHAAAVSASRLGEQEIIAAISKAVAQADAAASRSSEIAGEGTHVSQSHVSHLTTSTAHTEPPRTTETISGLTANSSTSTTVDGKPTVLPIVIVAPNVGVVVGIPALAPPAGDDPDTPNGEETKSTRRAPSAAASTSQRRSTPSMASHQPSTSTTDPSACPIISSQATSAVPIQGVPEAKADQNSFGFEPLTSAHKATTSVGLASSTRLPATTAPPISVGKSLSPSSVTTLTESYPPHPLPQTLAYPPDRYPPAWGAGNGVTCYVGGNCSEYGLTYSCPLAIQKFQQVDIYTERTVRSSLSAAQFYGNVGIEGCVATFECEQDSLYGDGFTGADIINAGDAITAAGCHGCGRHELSRAGCFVTYSYCSPQECEALGPSFRMLKRQTGSLTSGSQEQEIQESIGSYYGPDSQDDASHFEPNVEYLISGTGLLRSHGYPEVAQLNGAILPVAGTNGQLEMVILKDISKLQRSVWVADHIYELALFVDFLSSGPQYSFLIQDVFHDPSCGGYIQNRLVGILNSFRNLIGADPKINKLKMIYLQTNGPITTPPAMILEGLVIYMLAIKRNFELVAENLGSLLEDIVPPGKPVKSQIQASFITWSHNVWNNAAARMKSDLHGQAPNGQYNLNDLNF